MIIIIITEAELCLFIYGHEVQNSNYVLFHKNLIFFLNYILIDNKAVACLDEY